MGQIKKFFLSIPTMGTLSSAVSWWLCADVAKPRHAGPPAAVFLLSLPHNHKTRWLARLSNFCCSLSNCRRCLWWSDRSSVQNSSRTTRIETQKIAVGSVYIRHIIILITIKYHVFVPIGKINHNGIIFIIYIYMFYTFMVL